MLKGTDLTKSHDGAPLFDGVSLTLDDGARAALVGVNGVGKTTLIEAAGRASIVLIAARSRSARATASATCRRTCSTRRRPSTTCCDARSERCGR